MIARTFLTLAVTAAIVLSALPASAVEIWVMTTPEGTCRISFLQ